MDQIKGICGVKHEPLVKYHAKTIQLAKEFKQIVFEHIPRTQNEEADHLSRLTTTYYGELSQGVYVEVREVPAYKEAISFPVLEEPNDWRTPIACYLVTDQLLESSVEARKVKNRIFRFYMYKEKLYKKSWDGPLLNCVSQDVSPKYSMRYIKDGVGAILEEDKDKLSPKWEDPYRVRRIIGPGTYELERMDVEAIPRIWHASKFAKYYV
ncbi:hypothetical protein LIER_10196 [Lithospermum erythrorhizon]|uniref:RNase H type-1 domain-containing protein n=1 Tax=Lithospermum erythrorhizon TaxID=34254 RepID=A0AAV3PKQ7_LITER